MSDTSPSGKKLKIISLEPKAVLINSNNESVDINEDSVIVAPFFVDREEVIENLSELIETVYNEFDSACKTRNLNWEAELELGMEFGVKFTAKLKISPKLSEDSQSQNLSYKSVQVDKIILNLPMRCQ